MDGQFPIDVPTARWNDKSGLAVELAALEHAGLVQSMNVSAVPQSLASALSLGPHKAAQAMRYEPTARDQRFFRKVSSTFGPSDGFCYGHEEVDSIVNWSNPTT